MVKIKRFVLVLVCILLLSGCVKERITMSINKDKSMNLEVEMLVEDSLAGEAGLGEDVKEYEARGFSVTQKKEEGYSGYVISKKFNNIDDLSKNNGEAVAIDNILESDFDMSKLFTVKKGFLKNTYTAKFTFEFDQSQLNTDDDFDTIDEEEVVTTEKVDDEPIEITIGEDDFDSEYGDGEVYYGDEDTTDGEDDIDYSQMLSGMEFKYTVKLPSKGKNHNATNTDDGGRELIWNLATSGASNIEFSFDMYNTTALIIIGAGAVVLIIVIIIIISMLKKKKASKETLIHADYDDSIVGEISETKVPTEDIPQKSDNLEYTMPQGQVPTQDNVVEEGPMIESDKDDIVETPQVPETPKVEESVNDSIENTLAHNNLASDVNNQAAPTNDFVLDLPNATPITETKEQ